MQFLNTSILIVLVNWLIYRKSLRRIIFRNEGLANDAWFILLGNTIFPPLSNYLNPLVLIRLYKR